MSDKDNPSNIKSPDTNISKKAKVSPLKKVAIGVLIILVMALVGLAGLRITYSDEYLKNRLEEEITAATGAEFKIGSFSTRFIGFTATAGDLAFKQETDSGVTPNIVFIKHAYIRIFVIQSLLNKSIIADCDIDGFKLGIIRFNLEKNGKKEFTTNLNKISANILNLPWKKWLGDIDWKTAGGSVNFSGGEVTVHDKAGLLEDCRFSDITANLSRVNNIISFNFNFKGNTPASKNQTFDLTSRVTLAKNQSNKYLSFLDEVELDVDLNEIDAPYIMRYYGIGVHPGKEIRWLPGAPLNGNISLKTASMSSVKLKGNIKSPELFYILRNEQKITGSPSGEIDFSVHADMMREYSEFKPISVSLKMHNQQQKLVSLDLEARGSFDDEFVITMLNNNSLKAITQSSIGKVLDLNYSGLLNCNAAGRWSIDSPWKINLNLLGDNISTSINNETAQLPLKLDFTGSFQHDKPFNITTGDFTFNFKTAGLNVDLNKPVTFDFSRMQPISKSDFKIVASTPTLWKNFQGIFKNLNIGILNEQINGALSFSPNGAISWNLRSRNIAPSTVKKLPDITTSGRITPNNNNQYTARSRVQLANKTLITNIAASAIIEQSNMRFNINNSISAQIPALVSTHNRLSSLWHGRKLKSNLKGIVQEAANIYLNYVNKKFSIGINARATGTDIKGSINGLKIIEPKISVSTAATLLDTDVKNSLNIKDLKLRSSVANINLNLQEFDLNSLKEPIEKFIKKPPQLHLAANVGSRAFMYLNTLIKHALPLAYTKNASAVILLKSDPKSQKVTIKELNYKSPALSVEAEPFNIDLSKLTQLIEEKKFLSLQRSLDIFDIKAQLTPHFWRFIFKDEKNRFSGNLDAELVYKNPGDQLNIELAKFNASRDHTFALQAIHLAGGMKNFTYYLNNLSLENLLKNINKPLLVKNTVFSVQGIKESSGDKPSSFARAIRGTSVEINDLELRPTKNLGEFRLSARARADLEYFGKTAKWPMLVLKGSAAFNKRSPLLLKITKDRIATKGSLDLTDVAIDFNALNPYHYRKPANTPTRLDFNLTKMSEGSIYANEVVLNGGPLPASLENFSFIPEQQGDFSLDLKKAVIGSPFNTTITNLRMHKPSDTFSARIQTSGIDFSKFNSSFRFANPIKFSGSLGKSSVIINDSYNRYFMPAGTVAKTKDNGKNIVTVGEIDLKIASSAKNNNTRFAMTLEGGEAKSSSGEIILNHLKIGKPEGYNVKNPVQAKRITIVPDLQTIFSDQLIINLLQIDGLDATYEMGITPTRSNIFALRDNIDALFPTDETSKKAQEDSRKTLIKVFTVKDGEVKFSSTIVKGKLAVPMVVDFTKKNIGSENPGTTLASVFNILFSNLGSTATGILKGMSGTVRETTNNIINSLVPSFINGKNKENKKDNNEPKNTLAPDK